MIDKRKWCIMGVILYDILPSVSQFYVGKFS